MRKKARQTKKESREKDQTNLGQRRQNKTRVEKQQGKMWKDTSGRGQDMKQDKRQEKKMLEQTKQDKRRQDKPRQK